MSAHLPHETLWSHARAELDAATSRATSEHLASCADCRVALEDITLAQGALFQLPEVPPMPEAMARRIGARLAEEADSRAAKSFTSWWQSLFTPRFALALALGIALVVVGSWLLAPATPTVSPTPSPVALPTPVTPAPNAPTPVVAPVPRTSLKVTVASARKATATKKQELDQGAVVSTQTGGSLWMNLPDGSRAGLTSASEVTLAKLEKEALTLDIAKGSLALVVPHREDRVLTVKAGDLEVKDLGTRFLVSRQPSHTVVAVEEGVVEVKTPKGTQQVRAGHAVSWKDGTLSELDWEPTPPPQPKVVVAPAPDGADAQVNSIARLEEEDEDEVDESVAVPAPTSPPGETQPTPDRTPVAADEQWEGLPPTSAQQGKGLTIVPAKKEKRERGFSLRNLERKLREIGAVITTPTSREARARNVMLAADAGDCAYALQAAEAWLKEPSTGLATEASMKRGVQLQQVRCLNHLGRKDEASALQKVLDGR